MPPAALRRHFAASPADIAVAPDAILRYGMAMANITSEKKPLHSQAPLAERAAAIGAWLIDHKALNLARIDLSSEAFADVLFVVSAQSARQGQALADGLAEFCRETNQEFLGMEGYQAAQWILVDLNDILVNIFQEQSRELYKLEDLWQQAAIANLEEK